MKRDLIKKGLRPFAVVNVIFI
ncbi:protein of unknown function [Methylocaldum szegediense]|uniref:Uncharacterized protein n=1 Tax=Methylocaldum szegediense TaxID=73780 RepID=A0ABM9HYJ4_9GAMM|nr:protein of unknown function [Methylocaldum szegediense]